MHPYVALPAVGLLVLRAWSNNSLTSFGIVVAAITGMIHALHPWSVFFALLVVFFLGGSAVTKIKQGVKAHLTISSDGGGGGERPRTHIQVLANSIVASILIVIHILEMRRQAALGVTTETMCWPYGKDLLVVGIVANYAAVAADTFSSELGILSESKPRLITSWNFRQVPAGTNGGVTLAGTMAGLLGAFTIALTSVVLLPFCTTGPMNEPPIGNRQSGLEGGTGWGMKEKALWVVAITLWGGLGSLVDSLLGGLLQATVIDVRTGKVVEGHGGVKVLVHSTQTKKNDDHNSRRVESGIGLLDNNGVNFFMALMMSCGGMFLAGYLWRFPSEENWNALYARIFPKL